MFVHKNSLLAWKPTKIVPLTVSMPFIGYMGNLYDLKCFYEYTLVNVCHADADNMHLCVDYFVIDSSANSPGEKRRGLDFNLNILLSIK